jgi:hypothetical protein
MKYLLIGIVALLAGCSTTVPVKRTFPEVPAVIMEKCPQLKTIDTETTVFSVLSKTVTENYTTYYECATKMDGWIEWYTKQKAIFESVD